MIANQWIALKGRLIKGYRVASGPSEAYPEYGSIEKQKPYFKELGLNLDGMFNGTLNISIEPYQYEMVRPEYTFEKVKWTELTNPEDFHFSQCKIVFQGKEYSGWVYCPDPKTKREHFQSPSTIEILAPFIGGIKYGDEVNVSLDSKEIKVISP